jgi:hypothetical protein
MSDIQTEFGGSNPISLNEYYAGGSYVPSSISGVPSSGTISMNNLRGKTKSAPYTISVSTTATTEGNAFYITISNTIPAPVLYWKITDYTALTSNSFNAADFTASSGTIYYDYDYGEYPAVTISTVTDSVFDTGTFKVTFYTDSSYTQSVGSSTTLTLADTYTATAPTLSRTSMYRYANLDTAYMGSSISMSTSGLEGAALYYEVYTTTSGTSLSSADLDAPMTLTGSQVVPTGGTVQLTVRATKWDGSQNVPIDKLVRVRWRLGDANGAVIGTSPDITLYRMPVVSFGCTPSTIREGYASTLWGDVQYVPYGAASTYFSLSGSASTTDIIWYDGATMPTTGMATWNQEYQTATFFATIDTLSESTETLTFTWHLDSPTGTAFWAHNVTIESPAQIVSASVNATTVSIDNVSSYYAARNFPVLWRMRPAGSGSYGSWNTPISGSDINIGSYGMSGSTQYTDNPGTNNASYDIQVQISGSGYDTYTATLINSSQTIPVYSFTWWFTGANSSGAARTLYANIGSTPAYPIDRHFVIEYNIAQAGSGLWSGWSSGFLTTVDVAANSTSSNTPILRPTTNATAQWDAKLRCVLAGNQIFESPVQYGLWL